MSPKISVKEDYVLIEPKEGTDYREIRRGVARLFYAEGIPPKNRIWVFRKGPEQMSPDDLHRLRDVIKENYPQEARIHKTAIVVESDLQSAMATLFTQIAQSLPQEFRVFSTLQAAEEWVKE